MCGREEKRRKLVGGKMWKGKKKREWFQVLQEIPKMMTTELLCGLQLHFPTLRCLRGYRILKSLLVLSLRKFKSPLEGQLSVLLSSVAITLQLNPSVGSSLAGEGSSLQTLSLDLQHRHIPFIVGMKILIFNPQFLVTGSTMVEAMEIGEMAFTEAVRIWLVLHLREPLENFLVDPILVINDGEQRSQGPSINIQIKTGPQFQTLKAEL